MRRKLRLVGVQIFVNFICGSPQSENNILKCGIVVFRNICPKLQVPFVSCLSLHLRKKKLIMSIYMSACINWHTLPKASTINCEKKISVKESS